MDDHPIMAGRSPGPCHPLVMARAVPDGIGAVFTTLTTLLVLLFIAIPLWLIIRQTRRKSPHTDKHTHVITPQMMEASNLFVQPATLDSVSPGPTDSTPLYPTADAHTNAPYTPTRKPCKCQGCRRARAFAFGQHYFDFGGAPASGYVSRPLSPISEAHDDSQNPPSPCPPDLRLARIYARDASPALSLVQTAKDPPPLLSQRSVFAGKQHLSLTPDSVVHGLLPAFNDDHLVQARHPPPSFPSQPRRDPKELWMDPLPLNDPHDPPLVMMASVSAPGRESRPSSSTTFPLPVAQPTSPVWDELPPFSPTLSFTVPSSPSPTYDHPSVSMDVNISHDIRRPVAELAHTSPRNLALSDAWLPDASWLYSDASYPAPSEDPQGPSSPVYPPTGFSLGLEIKPLDAEGEQEQTTSAISESTSSLETGIDRRGMVSGSGLGDTA